MDIGEFLQLFRSQASLYTSQILFNQFFARKSFLDYPLMVLVHYVISFTFQFSFVGCRHGLRVCSWKG